MEKLARAILRSSSGLIRLTALAITVSGCLQPGTLRADETDTTHDSGYLGKFRNTYYYVSLESDYPNAAVDSRILTLSGEVLARVSSVFKKALDIEGSGKLKDDRVVNFAGRKNGEHRYRMSRYPFGEGAGNCELIPFHTIAVDPKRIPLGSLVQIDETVGMVLPDGSIHDGLWRAEDVGSAIKKDRIDLFIGTRAQAYVLQQHGITHLEALTIRTVTPPDSSSCVHQHVETEDQEF
jgi:3D (Asp-Asp-Asp) domain-containing protein